MFLLRFNITLHLYICIYARNIFFPWGENREKRGVFVDELLYKTSFQQTRESGSFVTSANFVRCNEKLRYYYYYYYYYYYFTAFRSGFTRSSVEMYLHEEIARLITPQLIHTRTRRRDVRGTIVVRYSPTRLTYMCSNSSFLRVKKKKNGNFVARHSGRTVFLIVETQSMRTMGTGDVDLELTNAH